MSSSIEASNKALEKSIARLRKGNDAGELCALELADPELAEDRLDALRMALSDGASPASLGPLFVVTTAELAYLIDWSDHFSFWPRLNEMLGCPSWDPRVAKNRDACTAAYYGFAEKHGALQPTGRFAREFPHMSWPLFHAVLPRTAHRRMAKLLADAVNDPGIIVAADGCPDEVSLANLLRSFALRDNVPAYFEGLLGHPTLLGHVGAQLLRAKVPWKEDSGEGWLLARIAKDLKQDPAAAEVVIQARREAARRGKEGNGKALPPISLRLTFDVVGDAFRPRIEIEGIQSAAGELATVRAAVDRPGARLVLVVGDVESSAGSPRNLLFGSVNLGMKWPRSANDVSIGLRADGPNVGDGLNKMCGGAIARFTIPTVYASTKSLGTFEVTTRLVEGQRVAVFVEAAATSSAARAVQALGFSKVAVSGTTAIAAYVGTVPSGQTEMVTRLRAVLELPTGASVASPEPVLVPALRYNRTSIEWLEGVDGFVLFPSADLEGECKAYLTGPKGEYSLPWTRCARGVVAKVAAGLGPGRASLRNGGQVVGQIDVSRRPALQFREAQSRYRVALVPREASLGHLLGDACGLAVDALPGVRLRLTLSADEKSATREIEADAASVLRTATLISQMWRDIGTDVLALTRSLMLTVEDQDAQEQEPDVLSLSGGKTLFRFLVSESGAEVTANDELSVPGIRRYAPGQFIQDEADACEVPIRSSHSQGTYVATNSIGERAALVWAGNTPRPATERPEDPKEWPKGLGAARIGIADLRMFETAAIGPLDRCGKALMLRHAEIETARRRVVATLCGNEWMRFEANVAEKNPSPWEIAVVGAPLLWVPRSWLREEFVELARGAEDLCSAVEQMCQDGVGDILLATDKERARHIALVFTRAALSSSDDDSQVLTWASADVVRPRLIRLLALAMDAAAQKRDGNVRPE